MDTKEARSGKPGGEPSRTYHVEADELLPDLNDAGLRNLLGTLSGRSGTAKQAHMVRAVIKRREGKNGYRTAKELGIACQTLRGWLVRIAERGPDGLHDRHASNRMRILDDTACECILGRVSLPPTQFGYESGSWDPRLLRKIISDELGIHVSLRTLRRTLRRLGLSFSKKRPTYRKSATPEEQERFSIDTQRGVDAAAKDGFTTVYGDEMACQPGDTTRRGRHLPEDCLETVNGFAKVLTRVFGALGKDSLHVRTADAANSETFIEFLEELRRIHTRLPFIADNASYHKSREVDRYLESADGDVRLLFLPKYTPQLNPIEIQWRMIKARLAGRYFERTDELNAAIRTLVESGEVLRVNIRNLPIP